mmetsp:Transcript_1455/g.3245  ORF Transcript_1455/g.3245 Transcript_1455/m.3245 type:complete len:424 (-) Transcript_1455:41-1312(-)
MSDSDSDGPPSLCQSSSSVDDEVMGDSTVENGLSAPAQTAPAAGHPGAHGASGSVNTRRSGQNVAGGDDSDSDSDSPPALCASSSSSDSEDMDDLEQAPPNARLGGDQGWAGAQPNAHNASSANTQQPAPSQQNGGRNFQSWGPSQAPPMMHQNFVFGGPALGVTIGPLGSGVPAMFDMLSSAMWGGDGAGMWGVDPFLAALQASLNMEQREKPKASAAALETVLFLKLCGGDAVECPISAETMEEGAWAARMPCGHYFAHEGLLQWLNQNNTCPVCRFEIPTVDEEYNRYKDVSLARTQEAARVANGQSADIVGQRMRRAQAQMLEEVLTAELNKLPPAASRSALGPGDATMEEEGGNVLLRELHRERALRAQQKQALNSEEAAVESALLEVLLARQHQLCAHALPQGEAVDGGLLPFSVKV